MDQARRLCALDRHYRREKRGPVQGILHEVGNPGARELDLATKGNWRF